MAHQCAADGYIGYIERLHGPPVRQLRVTVGASRQVSTALPIPFRYNFDSETTLGFLDHHGLIKDYALNLEANHGTLAGHSG